MGFRRFICAVILAQDGEEAMDEGGHQKSSTTR